MNMMKTLSFLLGWLLLSFSVQAQGPPILTGTPIMLGLEGNGIRTFGKFIAKEDISIYIQPIAIPYNITPKFQIGGILPFKYLKPAEAEAVAGFTDISLFAKYQLFKKDGRAKTFRIIGKLQHTFPSGNTLTMPPIGSGIHQTYLSLIAGRGKGTTNRLLYNFAVSLPLLPQQYPQKQVNTLLEFMQFIPGRRILLETSLQIPLQQAENAPNKTRYMLLAGIRFLLN